MKIWQKQRDQSHEKLKVFKPWANILGGNRKNEIKLTRICIGHSRLTHCKFMSPLK